MRILSYALALCFHHLLQWTHPLNILHRTRALLKATHLLLCISLYPQPNRKLLNSTRCVPSWIHLGVQHAMHGGRIRNLHHSASGRNLTIQGDILPQDLPVLAPRYSHLELEVNKIQAPSQPSVELPSLGLGLHFLIFKKFPQ